MSGAGVTREEVDLLRAEIRELRGVLERLVAAQGGAALSPANDRGATQEPLSEELAAVIGAAVAAFLGKRATVKFVRQLHEDDTSAWRAQSRATVAATRQPPRMRGW